MDIFSIFFNMKLSCVFSLELPQRGNSKEYTQYTIFNIKKKITLNYPKSAAMSFCSKGLKNEFETALVNETSVFKPLKFYPTSDAYHRITSLKFENFLIIFHLVPKQRQKNSFQCKHRHVLTKGHMALLFLKALPFCYEGICYLQS